jgi:hypothetical protein
MTTQHKSSSPFSNQLHSLEEWSWFAHLSQLRRQGNTSRSTLENFAASFIVVGELIARFQVTIMPIIVQQETPTIHLQLWQVALHINIEATPQQKKR